jgi:hypothetical protein
MTMGVPPSPTPGIERVLGTTACVAGAAATEGSAAGWMLWRCGAAPGSATARATGAGAAGASARGAIGAVPPGAALTGCATGAAPVAARAWTTGGRCAGGAVAAGADRRVAVTRVGAEPRGRGDACVAAELTAAAGVIVGTVAGADADAAGGA